MKRLRAWWQRSPAKAVLDLLRLPQSVCTLCWLLVVALIVWLLIRVFQTGGAR